MIAVYSIVKELVKEGIPTTLKEENGSFYWDLHSGTKSHMHLYEDGTLKGRYDYETKINLEQSLKDIVTNLCFEFNVARYGNEFGLINWFDLCVKYGVLKKEQTNITKYK